MSKIIGCENVYNAGNAYELTHLTYPHPNPLPLERGLPSPFGRRAGDEGEKRRTIIATVDMGAGGAGFSSVVYAQEVHTGKTFHTIMSASSHGLVVLPTSPPVSFAVDAPGTYVFYAVLINEDSYHFGSTECKAVSECLPNELVALDVLPNETYEVYIGDAKALIPPTGVPVTVPWHP